MKPQHTPGPWKAEQGNYSDAHKRAGEDWYIGAPNPDKREWASETIDVCHMAREADARLIAAAPELLTALELAEIELQLYILHNPDDNSKGMRALKVIRAAIAKAE